MIDCKLFNFIVWGVGGIAICCFGWTGNLLSLIALQRDNRNPAITLLQSLAVSDFVLLLFVCIMDSVPHVCDYTLSCSNIWDKWPHVRYLWLFIPMAHMCSIWLAVLIAANRYWAVCRPLVTGRVWTNNRTWIYVGCVLVGVVVFNIPRIFEYQVIPDEGNVTTTATFNLSISNHNFTYEHGSDGIYKTEDQGKHADLGLETVSRHSKETDGNSQETVTVFKEATTDFGKSLLYRIVYKVVLVNCLLILLPLGFLLFCSIWIIRSLHLTDSKSMVKKRKTSGRSVSSEDKVRSPSREVTFILVTVVLVAVACQTPLAVFHFVRYVYSSSCGDIVFYLENISKFLVNLNACVNFVIYCILGPRFRKLLLLALTCKSMTRASVSSKYHSGGEVELLNGVTEADG